MPKTLLCAVLIASLTAPVAAGDTCRRTARIQRDAAMLDLRSSWRTQIALCENLTDPAARSDCLATATRDFKEGRELVRAQYRARLDLCDLLGGGAYDPDIDAADFSTVIDNPYLPWPVGASWVYESVTEDGLEVITVTVEPETREILGVECVTVRDVVTLDGEVIEDTLDWYAQDAAGNVWYFGEVSFTFDEDGFVEHIDGTWLAGRDGAKPGIVMMADPTPGTTYRQEWLIHEAEDAGTVLANDVSVTLGIGTFDDCVQTADFLPPEPDALEHKFFAPGIGFIYETKPGSDEVVELVSTSGL